MKNKKLTYGLLIVVAALWGLIFYRIFDPVSVDNPKAGSMTLLTRSVALKSASVPKNFTLLLNYRDPFLGTTKAVKESASTEAIRQLAPTEFMDWSFVQYLGVIKNPETNQSVTILNIHGKDYMMKEGNTVEGVKLIRNYKDSVKIAFGGTPAIIKR